jgi:hypothetical protein
MAALANTPSSQEIQTDSDDSAVPPADDARASTPRAVQYQVSDRFVSPAAFRPSTDVLTVLSDGRDLRIFMWSRNDVSVYANLYVMIDIPRAPSRFSWRTTRPAWLALADMGALPDPSVPLKVLVVRDSPL